MKILIICDGNLTTMNTPNSLFALNQVKALKTQNIDVAMLELDMRSIRRKRKWGFFKGGFDGITVYRMAVPCGPIPVLLPFLAKMGIKHAFKKIIKSFGIPNIIHAHFGITGSYAIQLKNKYNVPFVLTEHNSGIIRENRTKKTENYSKKAYAATDKLIAVGNMLKENMKDLSGKDIAVIPNVLPSYFYFKDIKKSDSFTFISVGSFIAGKRFDITIKAFARINTKYVNTRLKIVGTGELKNDLIKLANESNIADKVEFLGVIPNNELPDIYNTCHCFILPSMFETFGVVYAEAMACGIPVIATKCGGPEDFVNESNGLLIPTDDLDAAAQAMDYIYHNSKNYDGEQISKDILEKTGEETVAKDLIDIYVKLLK